MEELDQIQDVAADYSHAKVHTCSFIIIILCKIIMINNNSNN